MTDPAPDEADKIAAAVEWLCSTPRDQRGGRAVPALRQRFGLSTRQAVEAVRAHNQRLARAPERPNAD